jgi:outer membrane protein OmpA-like peptidoglycan-associated protein
VRVPDTGIKPAEFQFLLPGVKSVPIKLPDGVNLSIPESSFLNRVYQFLAEAGDTKSRVFVFEHLNFDGASIKTAPETESSVKVVSALLKAYPDVQLRVEGHTDNVGDANANRGISQDRADAVKEVLVKAGVPADRISTEGHGSEKPIAPNDTAENRAKNRRIELVVVKK